jgi:hypothetical protein
LPPATVTPNTTRCSELLPGAQGERSDWKVIGIGRCVSGLPGCLRLVAMSRILFVTLSTLISIPVLLFLTAWLYPRPVDTTPPWVFENDGSELDYCELPELDGSGLMASDIPRAYTPGCGYTQYPQPILRDCTEPLPEGAQDLRGLWQSVSPALTDHVERFEQCGDRVVITTAGGHT